ncbi:MAG: acetate--CoA ligase family protein [Candidatus Marsarchaeota archaeon]|jgi:succinyl-CoA synthetase beta subunit|nr:acetate--CoA ligase family protein [Candidatus Marsarchaeota archaeon]
MTLSDYFEGEKLLKKYGISSIRSWYVSSAEEAIKRADGNPIVMKVISDKALHKSKSGLVALDLKTDKEISSAFKSLTAKAQTLKPYKVIVQEMSKGGIEVIIGGKTDPQFGKVILLGLGGIYVEAFKDFAIRVCPIDDKDAGSMIDSLRSAEVITYNSENKRMLGELLVKVSKMLNGTDLKELDLNPVILRKDGYDVVDIRILK